MKNSIYINGNDAYTRYGIDFEAGAVAALLTAPALKAVIENESRLEDGTRTIVVPRKSKRELTLSFHLLAPSEEEFYRRYNLFCKEVLEKGTFNLRHALIPHVTFSLVYNSMTQLTQFAQRMALFSLKCTEPNPSNR